MIGIIKKLLGIGNSVDYAELVKNGAIIVDVRSKAEYESGAIKNSINIPVDILSQNLNKLKDKRKPIITCCASGMRSSRAKSILTSSGYETVVNGGSWVALKKKFKQ